MNLTFNQIHGYFEARLGEKIPAREKVSVRCPIHGDHTESATAFLSGNGGFNCHRCGVKGSLFAFEMAFSQCDFEQARKNISEITGADLTRTSGKLGACTAVYDYRTANELLAFQKRRFESVDEDGNRKKTFLQYHPEGDRMVSGFAENTPRVLYNLSEVITANILFFTEGEKDAENLKMIAGEIWPDQDRYRIACSCNYEGAWEPGQSPKWQASYNPFFAGKQLYLFVDNDACGRTWADHICRSVTGIADTIRIVDFRDLDEKYDASDCLSLDCGKENLISRIKKARRWVPDGQHSPHARPSVFEAYFDFMSRKPPVIEWMVEGFIQRGSNGVFVAEPKGGKSFAVVDLCHALATGTPWLGLEVPNPVRVGLVSREDNEGLTRWRLAHLEQGRTLNSDQVNLLAENLYINSKERTPTLMLDNEAELNELIAEIKARQLEIVFLDVFNILHAADENDATEMRAVMEHVRRIQRECKCAVALIHHFNKNENGSLSKRIRGSSAIAGWAVSFR